MIFIGVFGGQFPNILVIAVFVAMFKRRHHAFSYLVLWSIQVFFDTFFKLAFHQARPSMISGTEIPWTPNDQIIDFGAPSGGALTSMSIFVSLAVELICHNEDMSDKTNMVRAVSTASEIDSSMHIADDY